MIAAFLRRAFALNRAAKQTVDAADKAREAYEGGAGLPAVILAYTGGTSARADDLTSAAVMEGVDGLFENAGKAAVALETGARALELGSQTLAGLAHEARELEAFLARLRGGSALRDVLEGEG